MSSPFIPSSIPPGSTGSGPFSPASIPGSGGTGGSGVPASAGTIAWPNPLVQAGLWSIYSVSLAFGAWPAANRALLYPFSLPVAKTVQKVWWYNGGTVSGNIDAGVYNEDGTRVVTTGSVAQAGLTTPQVANLSAPTLLAAGSYFFAMCMDNTTGLVAMNNALNAAALLGTGMQQAAAAVPMGATLTLAAPAAATFNIFSMGFTTVL